MRPRGRPARARPRGGPLRLRPAGRGRRSPPTPGTAGAGSATTPPGSWSRSINGNGGVTRYELRRQRPGGRDHRSAGRRDPPRVRRDGPLHRRDRPARPHHPRRLRRRRPAALAGATRTGGGSSGRYDDAGRPSTRPSTAGCSSRIEPRLRGRRAVDRRPQPTGAGRPSTNWTGTRRGRLVSPQPRRPLGDAWTYDADGRRTSMTTPDGRPDPLRVRRRRPGGRGRPPAARPGGLRARRRRPAGPGRRPAA